MVAVTLAAVTSAGVVVSTAVAASKQVGSMVADWSLVELARAEVASALAPCIRRMAFRTSPAQDPGSLPWEDHRPDSLYTTDDLVDP